MLEFVLIAAGFLLQLVGLAGCILPFLAGPPLNFLGLLLLCLARGWDTFSPRFLVTMGVLTLLTMVLDYVLPLAGAKRYGSTKRGFWGALIGMLVGTAFFPPFGMIAGALLGAVAGEISAGKKEAEALRAGWGAFVGVLSALLLKLVLSGFLTFHFIKAIL